MSQHPRHPRSNDWQHGGFTRREAIQAGAVGILGLGMNHLVGLREADADTAAQPQGKAKSLIFIFLSGGLSQHDSFDMKPNAPENVRGEFKPIATKTPGLQICEHLPLLAARSEMWALCRSMTHGSNEHSAGHHIMLTGHSDLPTGFSPNSPKRSDRASIAAIAGYATRHRQKNNLPTAVVLPERLVHNSGRVIPGQHAGEMGPQHDPWIIEASPFHNMSYGAFPQYAFDHQNRGKADERVFQAPQLSLPHGLGMESVQARLELLQSLKRQRHDLAHHAQVENFDRLRQGAVSLLTESSVHEALDVTHADERDLDRYGRNSFGWSLLMARKLVSAGVSLIQVNLGNDEPGTPTVMRFPI